MRNFPQVSYYYLFLAFFKNNKIILRSINFIGDHSKVNFNAHVFGMHLNEILEKYDGKFAHYSNEGPESLWYKFKQSLQNKKFDLSIGRQVLRAVMAKQVKHTKGAKGCCKELDITTEPTAKHDNSKIYTDGNNFFQVVGSTENGFLCAKCKTVHYRMVLPMQNNGEEQIEIDLAMVGIFFWPDKEFFTDGPLPLGLFDLPKDAILGHAALDVLPNGQNFLIKIPASREKYN